jgi:TonB family protein
MKRLFIKPLLLACLLFSASDHVLAQKSPGPEKNVNDPEAPRSFSEQMPQFPGGETKMIEFISTKLIYPKAAIENGIEGKVVVQFIVDRNGNVTDAILLKKLSPECDRECLRIVNMMPRWIPGMQDGKTVAVKYNLPISFKLSNGRNKRTKRD